VKAGSEGASQQTHTGNHTDTSGTADALVRQDPDLFGAAGARGEKAGHPTPGLTLLLDLGTRLEHGRGLRGGYAQRAHGSDEDRLNPVKLDGAGLTAAVERPDRPRQPRLFDAAEAERGDSNPRRGFTSSPL
jgi:hypothetical protein